MQGILCFLHDLYPGWTYVKPLTWEIKNIMGSELWNVILMKAIASENFIELKLPLLGSTP